MLVLSGGGGGVRRAINLSEREWKKEEISAQNKRRVCRCYTVTALYRGRLRQPFLRTRFASWNAHRLIQILV